MLFVSIGVVLVVKMVPHTTSALCYLIRWIDPPELILTISTATPDASLRDLYAPWSLSRKFAIVVDLKYFIAFSSSGSSALSSAFCIVISSFVIALPSSFFLGADLLGFFAVHRAGFYLIRSTQKEEIKKIDQPHCDPGDEKIVAANS